MGLFGTPPSDEYRKFNGKTYELDDWSKSKREIQKEAKNMKNGLIGISSYRIVKDGKYYLLYTR